MSKTQVVNLRINSYDIYIGRPSKWGNPFVIGKDGTREEVVKKYADYIIGDDKLMNDLHELKGKKLGCFCKPKACHGDILVGLIEMEAEFEEMK